jgi:hypothetical protein
MLRPKTLEINLKNAIRDIDRSSNVDREEENMERKTAGVTGRRLFAGVVASEDSAFSEAGYDLDFEDGIS